MAEKTKPATEQPQTAKQLVARVQVLHPSSIRRAHEDVDREITRQILAAPYVEGQGWELHKVIVVAKPRGGIPASCTVEVTATAREVEVTP